MPESRPTVAIEESIEGGEGDEGRPLHSEQVDS